MRNIPNVVIHRGNGTNHSRHIQIVQAGDARSESWDGGVSPTVGEGCYRDTTVTYMETVIAVVID